MRRLPRKRRRNRYLAVAQLARDATEVMLDGRVTLARAKSSVNGWGTRLLTILSHLRRRIYLAVGVALALVVSDTVSDFPPPKHRLAEHRPRHPAFGRGAQEREYLRPCTAPSVRSRLEHGNHGSRILYPERVANTQARPCKVLAKGTHGTKRRVLEALELAKEIA